MFVVNVQYNTLMDYYTIIKERRKILSITQEELADISGLSLRTIKAIETGRGNPSINSLEKLTDVLGIEIVLQVRERPKA